MSDSIELFWIRHGETQWNVDKRFQGQLNPPLNEMGLRQARLLAGRLATAGTFDVLVSSDLARATQTAEFVSMATGLPIAGFYKELRERNLGQLHELTRGEAERVYGPGWRELDLGRETDEALQARASKATSRLFQEYLHCRRFLIVSHGGLIRAFLLAFGLPITAPLPIRNTSITTAKQCAPGKWALGNFNDFSHLEESA